MIKVVSFVIHPIYIEINDETGLVSGEGQAPTIIMYPDKPFNIPETVKDIEDGTAFKINNNR